jgi:hypothetical protein
MNRLFLFMQFKYLIFMQELCKSHALLKIPGYTLSFEKMNDIKLCTIGEKLVLLRLLTKITTSGFLGLDARCCPCFY